MDFAFEILDSRSLNNLPKKSGNTATLGCASKVSAAKGAQARVPVLLKPALNRLFPHPVNSMLQDSVGVVAGDDSARRISQSFPFLKSSHGVSLRHYREKRVVTVLWFAMWRRAVRWWPGGNSFRHQSKSANVHEW